VRSPPVDGPSHPPSTGPNLYGCSGRGITRSRHISRPVSTSQRRRRDPRGPLDLGHEHRNAVDVAPRPLLVRFQRADQRVSRRVRVSGRVAVRRVIATSNMPALQADAQVQPRFLGGQTLLATGHALWEDGDPDVAAMRARHERQTLIALARSGHRANARYCRLSFSARAISRRRRRSPAEALTGALKVRLRDPLDNTNERLRRRW